MVRLVTRLLHQIIVTGTFITKIYQNFFFLVKILLQHIQDLDNHPDGTKRGFALLILEVNLKLVDGPSVKSADEMIPFWGYDSQIYYPPPLPRGFARYLTPTLSHFSLLASLEKLFPP